MILTTRDGGDHRAAQHDPPDVTAAHEAPGGHRRGFGGRNLGVFRSGVVGDGGSTRFIGLIQEDDQ